MTRPIQRTETRHGLAGMHVDAVTKVLADLGEPSYRAVQILEWIHRKGVSEIEQMTNLSRALREELAKRFCLFESRVVHRRTASDSTEKLLLAWPDGATSECVLIPDGTRRTACISTQVGCPVRCSFCASGLDGLKRNLTSAQIVEQAMRIAEICRPQRLTNVVFMGLGEPLHNYDATVSAVRTINAPWGLNIAARKITVSTVGLPKQIKRLAREQLQITLALSLHAPNDKLRREIIPWAESITLDSLLEAARYYFDQTGREITLEYILLRGLNDRMEHAHELVRIARKIRANINLIRYNPVPGLPFERPTATDAHFFRNILKSRGLNVHMRRSRGLDIDGACGQLRRRLATPEALAATKRPGTKKPGREGR